MKAYESNYYYKKWKEVNLNDIEKYLPEHVKVIHFISLDLFKEYCIRNNLMKDPNINSLYFTSKMVFSKYSDIFMIIENDVVRRVLLDPDNYRHYIFYRYINDEENNFIKETPRLDLDKYKQELLDKSIEILKIFEIPDLIDFIDDNKDLL